MLNFKDFFHQSDRANDNEVVYMYHNGISLPEIEQHSGRSRGDIYRCLKKHYVVPNRTRKRHQLVDYFHGVGYTANEIAKEVGMSPQGVRYILRKNKK
jgi:transposase